MVIHVKKKTQEKVHTYFLNCCCLYNCFIYGNIRSTCREKRNSQQYDTNSRNSYLNSSFYLYNHRTRSAWHEPMSLLVQCCCKANGRSALWSSALIPGSISPIFYPELRREQAFVSKTCKSPGGHSISPIVYPMLHGEIKESMSADTKEIAIWITLGS